MGKRCPVCKTDVPAEARDCPSCPHSFVKEEFQKPKAKFGPASWHPAVWVGVCLIGLLGIWRGINFVIENADPDNKHGSMQNFVDKQRIVVKNAQGQMKVISAGGGEAEAKAKQIAGVKKEIPPELETAMESSDDAGVTVDHSAPPPEAKEWRLRGLVYDLTTLEPIPHCAVFFTDPDTQSRFETSTDDEGAYRTILPSLHGKGYQVTLEKAGYARNYLNPGTENVPQMTAEDRRSLASDLAKSVDPPYDVEAVGAAPLKTDFYLAPTGAKRAD